MQVFDDEGRKLKGEFLLCLVSDVEILCPDNIPEEARFSGKAMTSGVKSAVLLRFHFAIGIK
jgi:hypothetical protein